jgi:hypothetical protein
MKFYRILLIAALMVLPIIVASESRAVNYGVLDFNFGSAPGSVVTNFTPGSGTLSTFGSGLAISSYKFGGNTYSVTNSDIDFVTGTWDGTGWTPGGSATITLTGSPRAVATTMGSTFSEVTLPIPGVQFTYQSTVTGITMALNSAGISLLGLPSGTSYTWDGAVSLSFLPNGQVFFASGQGTVNGAPVPIPPSALLMAAGFVGLVAARKRTGL